MATLSVERARWPFVARVPYLGSMSCGIVLLHVSIFGILEERPCFIAKLMPLCVPDAQRIGRRVDQDQYPRRPDMATKKTTKKKAPSKTRRRAKTDANAHQKNARQDEQRTSTKGGKAVVKRARRSVLDGAATILSNASTPMSCGEMIDAILKRKLWTTKGKTPAATLSSAILREIQRKGKESRFVKAERGRFRRSKSA